MYSGRANNRSAAYAQGPGVYPPSPDQSRIRNEIIAVGGGAVLSNAVGDERSLVEQLRLQEEYDLRNALKASKKVADAPPEPFVPPSPSFLPPINQRNGLQVEQPDQVERSPRQSERGDNEPQGRPNREEEVRASNFRTHLIAEQLEAGQLDPEEVARQEAILNALKSSKNG